MMDMDTVRKKRQHITAALQDAQARLADLQQQEQTLLQTREQVSQEYLRLHGAGMMLDELLAEAHPEDSLAQKQAGPNIDVRPRLQSGDS